MRPSTLMLSVLAHGGAIGAVAAVGAYAASETRRPPQVEIQHAVASAPSIAWAAEAEAEAEAPTVHPEPAELEPQLTEPALEPRPVPVVDERPILAPLRTQLRVSLDRIVPTPAPVEVVEEPPLEPELAEPAPAPAPPSVHVAAEPCADNPAPPYPRHERALGREGTVLLTVRIDRFGRVLAVELKEPSRYPGFNRAALGAVRDWRFTPGLRDGEPVADEIDVPIVFRLTDAAQ